MVGVILYLEDLIMLARINESLGKEVIGVGRDTIIGDVFEISALPLVSKCGNYWKSDKFYSRIRYNLRI